MKGSQSFATTIKNYLDKRASEDELFAVTYAKEGKSIADCCKYIINTVQKSGCAGFPDAEIFSMAVHYYDEDKIDVGGEIPTYLNIVVNHVVELTEEEKVEVKQKAMDKLQQEVINKMQKKKPVATKPVAPPTTPTADRKPVQPQQGQASLF